MLLLCRYLYEQFVFLRLLTSECARLLRNAFSVLLAVCVRRTQGGVRRGVGAAAEVGPRRPITFNGQELAAAARPLRGRRRVHALRPLNGR